MLFFFVTGAHTNTLAYYRDLWSVRWRKGLVIVPYENLHRLARIPKRGLFVFTDLDRIAPNNLATAHRLHRYLADAGMGKRVLNDPQRSMRRHELLKSLHAAGINGHNVYRIGEHGAAIRFPAFVRVADGHDGPLTGLLPDPPALARTVERLLAKGHDPDRLLVVEFNDVADAAGIRRKYSAFRIGGCIVPAHLAIGRDWMQKQDHHQDSGSAPERAAEELRYLKENPHADELLALFDHARIEYGRIDYGVLDGRIQVWEINTNPVLARRPDRMSAERAVIKRKLLVPAIDAAFEDALHPARPREPEQKAVRGTED